MSKIIENSATVYLHRDTGGAWEIDPLNADGYPLQASQVRDAVAEYGDPDDYTPEQLADANADADTRDMPTLDELIDLLIAARDAANNDQEV